MIKHSSMHHLLTIEPPPITEVYTQLYYWELCDHITEMRQRSSRKLFVGFSDVLAMRNRILLLW